MANFDNIIQEINTNLPDNNTQSITAAKLRTTLIDLTEQIDTVQDDFETEINEAIADIDPKFETNQNINDVSIVNNLITGGADNVLSAEQGVVLHSELSQLDEKLRYNDETIGGFDNGYYNTNSTTLPAIRNTLSGCKSAKFSVTAGQIYKIYGEGLNSNYYRFYAFYNVDGTQIDRYASYGVYRDTPLLVTVPTSAVTMVVNLGNYSATTDKVLMKGAYADLGEFKDTLDEHSEDIAKLEESENIVEDFVSSISYSRFSTNGYGVYNLGQNFSIQNNGDFFELRTRFYGEDSGFLNKLYFVSNDSKNGSWGFYSSNKIYFRAVNSDAWLMFDTPDGFDYKEFHIYKFQRTSVGFALYIDGSLIANKEYSGTGTFVLSRIGSDITNAQQKYDVFYLSVSIGGVLNTYTDFWKGGENIEPVFYTQSTNGSDAQENLFYKYDAVAKEMKVYTKMNTNFAEFTIKLCTSRGTADDPIYYRYFWEIQPNCRVCKFENGEMIATTKKIIVGGESECVIRATNYNSTDFTGGVHGDESIDIDANCFVEFLADGKVVPIEQSTDLIECYTFEYRQLSALHKTATNVSNKVTTVPISSGSGVLGISGNYTYTIDGIDTNIGAYNVNSVFSTIEQAINTDNLTAIDGGDGYWKLSFVREIDPLHTIIGYHSKVTSFDAGYKVRNGLRFTETGQNMTFLWYVGILCLAKEFASVGYNDALEKASFTGTNTHMLNTDGTSRYYATNPVNGLSAVIDSRIVDGQGILSNEANNMHIWDRDIDSKYYNGTPIFTPNQKTLVGEMCLSLSD